MPEPLAITFFDVEGYTAFTAEHGDEAGLALADSLLDIAQELIRGSGGTLVKRMGDGLMAHFGSATRAVRCGLGTQRALQARAALEDDAPVAAAKVAIHWGTAVERDGDIFGNDVNLTSRLVDQCRGGQVLVTQLVVDELGAYAQELEVKRVGKVSGKGLRERPSAYRVRARSDAPGPRQIEVGEEGLVAIFLSHPLGDDLDEFFAAIRGLEAGLEGVGARVLYTGVDPSAANDQPELCNIVYFPSGAARDAFLEGRAGAVAQEGLAHVLEPRVAQSFYPLDEYGILFPDPPGG